jgi:hypothetical protein
LADDEAAVSGRHSRTYKKRRLVRGPPKTGAIHPTPGSLRGRRPNNEPDNGPGAGRAQPPAISTIRLLRTFGRESSSESRVRAETEPEIRCRQRCDGMFLCPLLLNNFRVSRAGQIKFHPGGSEMLLDEGGCVRKVAATGSVRSIRGHIRG